MNIEISCNYVNLVVRTFHLECRYSNILLWYTSTNIYKSFKEIIALHRVRVVEKKGDKILTLYVLKYWRSSSWYLTLSIVLTNDFTTFYSCNFIPRCLQFDAITKKQVIRSQIKLTAYNFLLDAFNTYKIEFCHETLNNGIYEIV